jgi:predicted methyltransferase MtxX (methanogen marker protein 4)
LKSKRSTLNVLLDTAFILPTLGIDVGREVESGIRKLEEVGAEIYYSRLSILESLWIAIRLMRNQAFDEERKTLKYIVMP